MPEVSWVRREICVPKCRTPKVCGRDDACVVGICECREDGAGVGGVTAGVRGEEPKVGWEAPKVRCKPPKARWEAPRMRCEAHKVSCEAPEVRCEAHKVRCEHPR